MPTLNPKHQAMYWAPNTHFPLSRTTKLEAVKRLAQGHITRKGRIWIWTRIVQPELLHVTILLTACTENRVKVIFVGKATSCAMDVGLSIICLTKGRNPGESTLMGWAFRVCLFMEGLFWNWWCSCWALLHLHGHRAKSSLWTRTATAFYFQCWTRQLVRGGSAEKYAGMNEWTNEPTS